MMLRKREKIETRTDRVAKKDLSSTVDKMMSDDYKERFIAEYEQVVIRWGKLCNMLKKMEDGTCEFEPSCPYNTLRMQAEAMSKYIAILECRAAIEDIDLEGDGE